MSDESSQTAPAATPLHEKNAEERQQLVKELLVEFYFHLNMWLRTKEPPKHQDLNELIGATERVLLVRNVVAKRPMPRSIDDARERVQRMATLWRMVAYVGGSVVREGWTPIFTAIVGAVGQDIDRFDADPTLA